MSMQYGRPLFMLFIFFISHSTPLLADTPPSDLTELSVKEILALSIKRESKQFREEPSGFLTDRLRIGYQYKRIEFDGYLEGDDERTLAEIQSRFNVVPTRIVQEAHVLDLTYQASDNLYFNFSMPYLKQMTDHVSNVGGFANFTIRTSGISDISLSASRLFKALEKHNFMLHGGMSFPTGSIDEKGDTPSAGTNNQLPYTMQLGSGTFDLKLGGSYAWNSGDLSAGADITTTFRLGKNSRGYSLGDRALVSTWFAMKPVVWLEPFVKFQYYHWGSIDGADTDLPAPGLVPVATPAFFGGEKVHSILGLKVIAPEGKFEGQSLKIEGGIPIHQYLNGPHPKENWRISVGWNWSY